MVSEHALEAPLKGNTAERTDRKRTCGGPVQKGKRNGREAMERLFHLLFFL